MYNLFAWIFLIGLFFISIINIVFVAIGRRPRRKVWQSIQFGSVIMFVCAIIGMIVTRS